MSKSPNERTLRSMRASKRTALIALTMGATFLAACSDDDTVKPIEHDASVGPITGDGDDGSPDGSDGNPDGSDGNPDGSDGNPDGSPDGSDGAPDGSDGAPDGSDGSPDGSDGSPDGSDGLDGGVDSGTDGGTDLDGGFPTAPLFRNPVAMRSRDLAEKALELMGSPHVGAEGSCNNCHDLGRSTLAKWRNYTRQANDCVQTYLSEPGDIDAALECIRQWDSEAPFAAEQLGVFAAASHLDWFKFAFQHRTGAGENWAADHESFIRQAGMPRRGERLSQADFDIVAEWFVRGIPYYREIVPADPGTATCTTTITPKMTSHIEQMATGGWRAKNRADGLLMYGCATGDTTLSCLSELPLARDTEFGATWDAAGSNIRILFDNPSGSSYWSRSSADGRYIASGGGAPNQGGDGDGDGGDGGFDGGVGDGDGDGSDGGDGFEWLGAKIIDLARGVYIPLDGNYDPGFFPDNSGFVMQANRGALVCDQSLLAQNPTRIDGSAPECGYFDTGLIGIYEQLGKTVGGSDYWVAAGQFAADNGGYTNANPDAPFGESSSVTLTPMINEGNRFSAGTPANLETPHQGDPVISASGSLLITRVKGDEVDGEWGTTSEQNGYTLQQITTSRDGTELSATLEEVARICVPGGKPMLSNDERFMVVHQYVTEAMYADLGFSSASAAGFRPYIENSTSNLVLIDLKTGTSTRITNVQPGQNALFPHFRSDGWIYFVVRGDMGEQLVASDAALVWEATH